MSAKRSAGTYAGVEILLPTKMDSAPSSNSVSAHSLRMSKKRAADLPLEEEEVEGEKLPSAGILGFVPPTRMLTKPYLRISEEMPKKMARDKAQTLQRRATRLCNDEGGLYIGRMRDATRRTGSRIVGDNTCLMILAACPEMQENVWALSIAAEVINNNMKMPTSIELSPLYSLDLQERAMQLARKAEELRNQLLEKARDDNHAIGKSTYVKPPSLDPDGDYLSDD